MTSNNSMQNRSWLERNPKKVIALFILIVMMILVFAVEYILSQKLYIENSANQRYVYIREIIPNTNTVGPSDQEDKEFVQVRTDSNGLILPSKIYDKPDSSIFFIGSSTLLTITIEENKRIPYLTGKKLSDQLDINVNSYNGAASSSNSFHGINTLVNKALPYSPDYLVFMYNAMDILDLRLDLDIYWKNNYQTVESSGLMGILKGIKNKFFPNIYYVLKKSLDFNIGAAVHNALNFFENREKKNQPVRTLQTLDYDLAKEKYTKNLQAIINICKAYNITPVIMTEPYSVKDLHNDAFINQIGLEKFLDYQNSFNTIIRHLALKNGIPLVDLDKELTYKDNEDLFVEKFHFNLKGVEKVTHMISDTIAQDIHNKKAHTLKKDR